MLADLPQGNSSEGRLLSDNQFLRRVAYLYYEDGQTQEAIAEMENCSRQTISKALQRAKERGIVRISVIPEQHTGYLRNLSRELRMKLGLDDLVLVPGRNLDEIPGKNIADDILADIAITAGDYLDQMLTDSDILAVSGGRHIMRQVVRYLKPTKLLLNLQVVPTIGYVKPQTSTGDANLIAYNIATAYGAKHTWLPIPAIVESQHHCEVARSFPIVKEVLKLMEAATMIMTGIWLPHSKVEVMEQGILSQQQVDAIDSYNPMVDINHWAFDASGRCINDMLDPPPYYLTGLEFPRLKDKIRKDRTRVILVAGASLAYVPAIRAALKAGIANILITDHVTAQLLLKSDTDD